MGVDKREWSQADLDEQRAVAWCMQSGSGDGGEHLVSARVLDVLRSHARRQRVTIAATLAALRSPDAQRSLVALAEGGDESARELLGVYPVVSSSPRVSARWRVDQGNLSITGQIIGPIRPDGTGAEEGEANARLAAAAPALFDCLAAAVEYMVRDSAPLSLVAECQDALIAARFSK